jgi:hemerythrin-like metal-binding protein
MSVGVPEIDADHKTLVGLINNLHHAIGDDEEYATLGSVLKALEDYAAHHFAREERMMEAAAYPAIGNHVAAHQNLAAQVLELKHRYDHDRTAVRAKDCLSFLNKWLVEHICSTDMDYRGWLVGHAGAARAANQVSITGHRQGAAALDWKALRPLVVDDNANFCEVMRTILGGIGVEDIRIARDLAAARAALEAGDVDAVITDWHVGVEDGLDLVRWIRADDRFLRLPVLVLSGHERLAHREAAVAAGADDFMEKPISARGLLICLARLVSKRKAG